MYKGLLRYLGFISLIITSAVNANQYDFMLYSNVYRDVRKGVELGADVNARLRGSTPLYDAARKNNMEILELLIDSGADVHAVSHGETALHKVVQFGNVRFAELLLKAGANPNKKDELGGNSALHIAVKKGNPSMIGLLMDYGADMNSANNVGDTPARFILSRTTVPPVSIENKDISLSSSSFIIGRGSTAFSIKNLTNEFVEIRYSALYVNGALVSEKELVKTIPPNSVVNSIGTLPITSNALNAIKISSDGVARVKYGFAIEYRVGNRKNSLYDDKVVDIKIW